MSAKLNKAQRNYSISELECYATILSIMTDGSKRRIQQVSSMNSEVTSVRPHHRTRERIT